MFQAFQKMSENFIIIMSFRISCSTELAEQIKTKKNNFIYDYIEYIKESRDFDQSNVKNEQN